MLDAFIIERLKREREERDSNQVPLHIEVPWADREEAHENPLADEPAPERGVVIIEDTI